MESFSHPSPLHSRRITAVCLSKSRFAIGLLLIIPIMLSHLTNAIPNPMISAGAVEQASNMGVGGDDGLSQKEASAAPLQGGKNYDIVTEAWAGLIVHSMVHPYFSFSELRRSRAHRLPDFLLGADVKEGAAFFTIESQMDVPIGELFEQKAKWAARQPPIIQHLYHQYLAERCRNRKRFDETRARILQTSGASMSYTERQADFEIHAVLRNVTMSRREQLEAINAILGQLSPESLAELRQQLPIIAPLSGNQVPKVLLTKNAKNMGNDAINSTTLDAPDVAGKWIAGSESDDATVFDYSPLATSVNHFLDPCNNFYKFVCDGYTKRHQIPPHQQEQSQHTLIDAQIEHQLIDLLEEGRQQLLQPNSSSSAAFTDHSRKTRVPLINYDYMLQDLYTSCVDIEGRNRLNSTPLLDTLSQAHRQWAVDPVEGALTSTGRGGGRHNLLVYTTSYVVNSRRVGGRAPFYSLLVEVDERDTSRHIFAIEPSYLYLYTPSYYLKNEGRSLAQVEALKAFLTRVITLLVEDDTKGEGKWLGQMVDYRGHKHHHNHHGRMKVVDEEAIRREEVERRVRSFIDVETAIARIFVRHEAQYPPQHDEIVSPYLTFGEFQQRYANITPIEWATYLESTLTKSMLASLGASHLEEVTLNIGNLFKFEQLNELIANLSAQEMSDYLEVNLILPMVEHLDERYLGAYNTFRMAIHGAEAPFSLQETCRRVAVNRLPRLLDKIYVERYYDKGIGVELYELFEGVAAAFARMLKDSDWMDEKTKRAAIAKLRGMRFNAGFFPHFFNASELSRLYSSLETQWNSSASYSQHLATIAEWHFRGQVADIAEPVAYYARSFIADSAYYRFENRLIALAGNLHRPFYYRHFPPAMNYGGIGTILGHEVSHGFDSLGSLFDERGRKRNWWGEKSRRAFARRKECLIDQYGHVSVPIVGRRKRKEAVDVDGGVEDDSSLHVDGERTLPENIADNGGIRAAYYAFKQHLIKRQKKSTAGLRQKSPAQAIGGLEEYSEEQLFFINWAFTHCTRERPQYLFNKLQQDEHAPAEIRTNVALMNMEEFAQAFQCPAESVMNPRRKCRVW